MKNLRIGTFSPSVLLEVCRATGRLGDAGLDVTEVPVASSPDQFRQLADAQLDGVVTNPDNVIAYRFVRDNPLGQHIDVVVTAALDRGLGLTLGLRPGLATPAALDSGTVAVDVPTSGYAFVAYALLEKFGLHRSHYAVSALGATPRRADALARGLCDGTILNAGSELRAEKSGCTLHGSITDVGPYLGAVLARLASTPSADTVDRLADVMVGTARDICEGELRAEVIDAAERLLGLSDHQAERHRDRLMDADEGLVADGFVDLASIDTLLELRNKYLPAPELSAVPAAVRQMLTGLAAEGQA